MGRRLCSQGLVDGLEALFSGASGWVGGLFSGASGWVGGSVLRD